MPLFALSVFFSNVPMAVQLPMAERVGIPKLRLLCCFILPRTYITRSTVELKLLRYNAKPSGRPPPNPLLSLSPAD